MRVQFINKTRSRIPRKRLLKWCADMRGEMLKMRPRKVLEIEELTLVFVGPTRARSLNRQYRGRDHATDILSFGQAGSGLCELVLCPQVLKSQADERGHSFQLELCYSILHGYLHLLGYEHEQGGQKAAVMMGLQDRVFGRLAALHQLF